MANIGQALGALLSGVADPLANYAGQRAQSSDDLINMLVKMKMQQLIDQSDPYKQALIRDMEERRADRGKLDRYLTNELPLKLQEDIDRTKIEQAKGEISQQVMGGAQQQLTALEQAKQADIAKSKGSFLDKLLGYGSAVNPLIGGISGIRQFGKGLGVLGEEAGPTISNLISKAQGIPEIESKYQSQIAPLQKQLTDLQSLLKPGASEPTGESLASDIKQRLMLKDIGILDTRQGQLDIARQREERLGREFSQKMDLQTANAITKAINDAMKAGLSQSDAEAYVKRMYSLSDTDILDAQEVQGITPSTEVIRLD